ncbi:hypothetical protein Tco_0998496 [Tanacetum coccineum]
MLVVTNKLLEIPTEMGDNGNEFVVFNDELLELCSQKWKSIICGYFIGYEVSFNEARSSALVSSLGKPIIMDDMTTKMCLKREGRIGFARVLVEFDAGKCLRIRLTLLFGHEEKRCKLNKKDKIEEKIVNGKQVNIHDNNMNNSKVEYRKKKEEGILENKTLGQTEKGDSTITMTKNEIRLRLYIRFTLLESLVNDKELVPSIEQRKVADEILRRKIDASDSDMNKWNVEMKIYYKDRKELFDVAPDSIPSNEMIELQECIADIEVRDILSTRFGINKWYQSFAWRNFDLEDMELESTNSGPAAKLPILKLGEYEMWVIRIKQYFQIQDYALWEVIENENEINKKNDVKGRGLLLMALPNEHQLTFSQYPDAKSMFVAIKTRFRGNAATKKTQKTLLKQQYENFSATSAESLDSIFNRLQKIVSRLAILGVIIAQEDLNLKILSSLPPE